MSGGYGSGGYPGQGHDEDPRQRRQAGGSLWGGDHAYRNQGHEGQGYDDRGYEGQNYGGYQEPGHDPQSHDPQGHDPQSHDPRGYDRQRYDRQRYDQRGNDQQGSGGYGAQGSGPQPGQYGGPGGAPRYGSTGGAPRYGGPSGAPQPDRPQPDRPQRDDPRYDQRPGSRGRQVRAQGDPRGGRQSRPPDRGGDGYDQRGGGRRQRGYPEWEQEESDSSFLPGFGGRDDYDNGRYAQERDDRRPPRGGRPDGGRPDGRGPEGRAPGRGNRGGPDPRAPMDSDPRGDRPADRRPLPGDDGDDDDWGEPNRQPRKRVTRWFPRILVLGVVAVILIGGGIGGKIVYGKYEARYHPADYAGPGTGDVVFQIKSGDTAFSIAPELYQMGIVASERAFTNAAEDVTSTTAAGAAGGSSGGLEAGYYNLRLHMKASLAYAALINPKNAIQTAVTIPEGERVSQVLPILAAKTKIPLSQFQAAAKETSKLGLPSYAGTTVKLPSTVPYGQIEGYLFPATYTITPHETALQILQAMVQRFDVEAQQVNLTTAAQSVGLTPGQLIIEASMVQAEAGTDSDMPKMASVIVNRKAKGMPDGFDSVVFYGVDKFGINIPDSLNPETAGPYDNTQHTGLPPTPIDNPGDAAIQAILHPAKTDYLYFLTVATGKPTEFSANCQDLPGTC